MRVRIAAIRRYYRFSVPVQASTSKRISPKFETTPLLVRSRGVFTPSSEPVRVTPPLAKPVLGCLLICGQCETIALSLTDEQFTTRVNKDASIGAHMRHCVEHFNQLFGGLHAGVIDYDARIRNCDLEKCRTFFLTTLRHVVQQLTALDESTMNNPVLVRMMFTPNSEPAEIASTLARELAFVSAHATHHIAIIKMLAHSLGTSLPDEYGVGVATMAYWMRSSTVTSRA